VSTHADTGRLLAGLAVTFLLVGCGAAGGGSTAGPATPAAAVATPAATPSPAAADRTYVSGTMTCQMVGEADPTASGEYQPGTLLIDCDCRMSDPRVTGTVHYELSTTGVDLDAVNGRSNFWAGTSTLEAEGGSWTGSGYGSEFVSDAIRSMTLYTTGTDLYEGQGALAGLTYRVMWARKTPLVPGVPYDVSGWIEPAG
jgi:hypothetical protein